MRLLSLLIALLIPLAAYGSNCFCGPYISGFVGWDFYKTHEKSANGLMGGGAIGYSWTPCWRFYLGARAGYRGFASDQLGYPNDPELGRPRLLRRHGGFVDLLGGLTWQCDWLTYLLVGGRGDRFQYLVDHPVLDEPLDNQRKWSGGPRFGIGVQKAVDCRLRLGAEYVFDYGDVDFRARSFKIDSHQVAFTVSYYL